MCTALLMACIQLTVRGGPKKQAPGSDSTKIQKIKKKKTFDNSLSHYKRYDGLLKIYQDTVSGSLWMVVRKDQLDKEFIYCNYAENGLSYLGAYRGEYRENKTIVFKKVHNRMEIVAPNTHYYFDTASTLSKSVDANINQGVLYSQQIQDIHPDTGEILFAADELFMSESIHRIKPVPPRGVPADAYLSYGTLAKNKCKIRKIVNYAQNTDVRVEYVFDNPHPAIFGTSESIDGRYLSVELQHTFIYPTDTTYTPRQDDGRVGYFTTVSHDLTTKEAINYKDVIHRWNLKKANPELAQSKPIKPIVWWMEKSTPAELRDTIKKAVLAWNPAFEAAPGLRTR